LYFGKKIGADMEFENIIYIILAIVFAIVNAVVQKKKKAAQAAASAIGHDDHEDAYAEESSIFDEIKDEISKSDPLEVLFGANDELEHEGKPATFKGFTTKATVAEESIIPKQTVSELQMHAKAKELLESRIEHIATEFDEDSIAASAIGDAPTEEEEQLAAVEQLSPFVAEFDVKKAIIYSEVIKPKYFSI
jgi:type III secretory pathway component EscV